MKAAISEKLTMLGTENYSPEADDMEPWMQSIYSDIKNNATGKEDLILKLLSFQYAYENAGCLADNAEEQFPAAESEILPYAGQPAQEILRELLNDNAEMLLYRWIFHCQRANKIVFPEFIYALYDIALTNEILFDAVQSICGRRGDWLAGLNPAWQIYTQADTQEVWLHGTAAQRKKLIGRLRRKDAAHAIALLSSSWKEEPAGDKVEFISQLSINLSHTDLEFLEECVKEKSQKVRTAAISLLSGLPGSNVVKQTTELAKTFITSKQTKSLLVLQKTNIEFRRPDKYEAEWEMAGISKTSNSAELEKFSEAEIWLHYMIISTPPSVWETHLQLSPARICELIGRSAQDSKFIFSFAVAAQKFHDTNWALILTQANNNLLFMLYRDIPQSECIRLAGKLIEIDPAGVFSMFASMENFVIPESLSVVFFQHFSKEKYTYNRSWFRKYGYLFHEKVITLIDAIEISVDPLNRHWVEGCAELKKVILWRIKIDSSF